MAELQLSAALQGSEQRAVSRQLYRPGARDRRGDRAQPLADPHLCQTLLDGPAPLAARLLIERFVVEGYTLADVLGERG